MRKVAIKTLDGQFCQCGRAIVIIGNMKMCGEQGCAADPAFCTCRPIGLVAPENTPWLSHLLRDLRGDEA